MLLPFSGRAVRGGFLLRHRCDRFQLPAVFVPFCVRLRLQVPLQFQEVQLGQAYRLLYRTVSLRVVLLRQLNKQAKAFHFFAFLGATTQLSNDGCRVFFDFFVRCLAQVYGCNLRPGLLIPAAVFNVSAAHCSGLYFLCVIRNAPTVLFNA